MAVLVVSQASSLPLALGSRLDVIGVGPSDVERWLETNSSPDAVIIDDSGGPEGSLRMAQRVRALDQWCPIVLLVSGDVLPSTDDTEPLHPLRLVRRPFTTARLVENLEALGAVLPTTPGPTLPPAEDALDATEVGLVDNSATPDVAPRRPLFRRRATRDAASPSPSLDHALATLLAADDLPSVADASGAVIDQVADALPTGTAIALLVADERGWRVAGGRGLRANELRAVLPHDHWLARRVDAAETAVIVDGTDVARQELQSAPLIHLDHWMATTLAKAESMVVLARMAEPSFTVEDALLVRDVARSSAPDLSRALLLRELARRLSDYRD